MKKSKRLVWLSVTHMLGAEQEADLDIGEPGHPSPDDHVAGWCVASASEITA